MVATQLDEWNESAWFRQWLDLAKKIKNSDGEGTEQGGSLPEGEGSEDQECETFSLMI